MPHVCQWLSWPMTKWGWPMTKQRSLHTTMAAVPSNKTGEIRFFKKFEKIISILKRSTLFFILYVKALESHKNFNSRPYKM